MNTIITDTRKIYNRMADDFSRDVFEYRLMYNLTGDNKYIAKLTSVCPLLQKIQKQIACLVAKDAAIFGAGKYGRAIKDKFPNINWRCFIDNNDDAKQDSLPLFSLEQYLASHIDADIVVTPKKYHKQIVEQLLERGIGKKRIYDIWEDDKTSPYFENFLPTPSTGGYEEIFIDAGVYDAQTTLDFLEWCKGNYKKIYMFEPSADYYERFRQNIANVPNCFWIQKGLWSEETVLKVFDRPDHDISIGQNLNGIDQTYCYEKGKWINIPVTALDYSIPNDERVTFIKMDIEGSEAEAIKGAKRIISEQKPKLAICLYHKLDDPWVIPSLIMNYNADYKFYLRHYSLLDMLDTVLYAI